MCGCTVANTDARFQRFIYNFISDVDFETSCPEPVYKRTMQGFIKHFIRENGAWTCVSPAEFNGPNGRIQVAVGSRFTRGTNFMGIDLAEWLDDQYAKDRRDV